MGNLKIKLAIIVISISFVTILRINLDALAEDGGQLIARESLRRVVYGSCLLAAFIYALVKALAQRLENKRALDFLSRYADYLGYWLLTTVFAFYFLFYVELR